MPSFILLKLARLHAVTQPTLLHTFQRTLGCLRGRKCRWPRMPCCATCNCATREKTEARVGKPNGQELYSCAGAGERHICVVGLGSYTCCVQVHGGSQIAAAFLPSSKRLGQQRGGVSEEPLHPQPHTMCAVRAAAVPSRPAPAASIRHVAGGRRCEPAARPASLRSGFRAAYEERAAAAARCRSFEARSRSARAEARKSGLVAARLRVAGRAPRWGA